VVPGLVKPGGADIKIFDAIRDGLTKDRSQYYFDLAQSFYSVNHLGDKVSHGTLEQFWRLSMQCGYKGAYDCVKAFSETDFSEDCKRIDVPTLVIHGDDDQIVPFAIGSQSAKMIKGAELKVFKGAPHGLMSTHRDQLHKELLSFAQQNASAETRAAQSATSSKSRTRPEDRQEPRG
jgi:non-heme chloroperoxidase